MSEIPIPKVINSLDVDEDRAYEPPYAIRWGVNRESTGTETITMGRTIIPPLGQNALHYHKNCDTTIYVVRGPIKIYWKEASGIKSREVKIGHFVYFPRGCVHGQENPSPSEPAELIFTYGAVPSKEAAGTTFVDDPRDPLKR
ncbi:MAG: cupin domain-containing protein [Candidatus Rokubacteria bacterium]|nr:cupin domain-containing protein [Candidatus Rokubacteria bacterium]